METKKVLGIIFSSLFVIAFAFVLTWGIINFNTVKDGMSGTGVYTKQDVDNAYNDGYNTALTDKAEYTSLISSYRDTITTLNDEISQLNSQVNTLQRNNKDYSNQVERLTTEKNTLQEQITNLTNIKETNETTIADLNLRIDNLNNQINDFLFQSQDTLSQISELNNKINELQKSIDYYESYIASLENEQQVVVTFEFNNSVYNIQVVNKNSTISVTDPISTDYVIFNYWTVNGEQINLSTYQITTNTKIIADVTYKYDVTFMVDGTIVDSQIVTKNGYATLPTTPTKDGYEFDGWTLNGTDIIDPTTMAITHNTTFTAKFTKLHTVTFMVDGTIVDSQIVTQNGYATVPTNPTKTGYVFNGWTTNGVDIISNINTIAVTENITYFAKFTEVLVLNSDFLDEIEDKCMELDISISLNSISFLSQTEKNNKLMTLSSGIDVYYSIDNDNLNIDIVSDKEIFAPYHCNSIFVSNLFLSCKSITFTNFNTSLVKDMSYMFCGFDGESLDLSSFDTSNVTNMSYMFDGCIKLKSLDLSSFDTSNVTNMQDMFNNCYSLTEVIVGENYTLNNLPD